MITLSRPEIERVLSWATKADRESFITGDDRRLIEQLSATIGWNLADVAPNLAQDETA